MNLPLVLLTLLQQRVRPDTVFVWLARDDFAVLDRDMLARFSANGIRFGICDDLRSHKKWLPLIEEGIQCPFVICDDDTLYPEDWLEQRTLEDREDAYVGTRCHEVRVDPAGLPVTYAEWNHDVGWRKYPSHEIFLTGCGGAVIHPERIGVAFRDRKKIMALCPSADDIWLKAAHLANGVPCYKTRYSFPCLEIPGSEATGLALTNVEGRGNDKQIGNLGQYFSLIG